MDDDKNQPTTAPSGASSHDGEGTVPSSSAPSSGGTAAEPGAPGATPGYTSPPAIRAITGEESPALENLFDSPYLDAVLGKTIADRYFVEKKLGAGGMGSVYLARHITLDKQFALKVLHGEYVRRPDLVERFLQEARAASRIRHDNIIDITDFGSTPDGVVFFAMEVLEGRDLHDEIVRARQDARPIPWSRSRRIFLQVCSALAAAHACGIIHRDLKPENVYLIERLGQGDFVKLLDFGIAKLSESAEGERRLTRTGMLFGTPEYMAPEQARGEPFDHRVDIYAMGCLLYQLIAGRVPFAGENFMSVLTMQMTANPPPIAPETFAAAGAPAALAGVITRALAKERDARFASMEDMIAAIEGVAADVQEEVEGSVPMARWPEASRPVSGSMRVPVQEHARVQGHAAATDTTPAMTAQVAAEVPADRPAGDLAARGSVPRPRRRTGMWLGTALALAASAGLGGLVLGHRAGWAPWPSASGPGATGAEAPLAQVLAGTAPADEPPLPARVTLTLDSEPEGATVTDGQGNLMGETPLAFDIPGGHEPRRFRFRLAGHADKLVELIPEEDIAYRVTLVSRPAAAGQGAAEAAAETEVVEIVPQEGARHRRSRQVTRTRRTDESRSEGQPKDQVDGQVEHARGGEAGETPQAHETGGEASGAGNDGDRGAAEAGQPAGERQADATGPGEAGSSSKKTPADVPAPAEQGSGAGEGTETEPRPKPRDPGPSSDPVLKNPFAQ